MNSLATKIDYSLPLSLVKLTHPNKNFQILKNSAGAFYVKGWSTGVEAKVKYFRLLKDLERAQNESRLTILFEYDTFDTSSARFIFKTIRTLNRYHRLGKKVTATWICDADDAEMIDTGLDFSPFCDFNFQIRLK